MNRHWSDRDNQDPAFLNFADAHMPYLPALPFHHSSTTFSSSFSVQLCQALPWPRSRTPVPARPQGGGVGLEGCAEGELCQSPPQATP